MLSSCVDQELRELSTAFWHEVQLTERAWLKVDFMPVDIMPKAV